MQIHDQNLQFIGEEVKGHLPSIVREFYFNLEGESGCGFPFGDYSLEEATTSQP